jgi:hypothetical protein
MNFQARALSLPAIAEDYPDILASYWYYTGIILVLYWYHIGSENLTVTMSPLTLTIYVAYFEGMPRYLSIAV